MICFHMINYPPSLRLSGLHYLMSWWHIADMSLCFIYIALHAATGKSVPMECHKDQYINQYLNADSWTELVEPLSF